MRTSYASALASVFLALLLAHDVTAQCDDISVNGVNNMAKTCRCADLAQTNCDLLPDIMISWLGLQNISAGPSEYAQNASSSAGRLRISGATPNVGFGPLEVRGVRADGYRKFICGPVVDSVYSPLTNNINFSCGNGYTAKQILFQRIYHKNDTTMSFNEYERGTMTYHPTHAHYHVNGWTTMTLRLAQPGVTDPTQWPVVASGGKLGFCLTNLYTCSGSPGYCKDDHRYGLGNNILNTAFGNNYALGSQPGCSDDVQSIVVGKGDIYDEGLDGMWINMLPGLCNGQYHIVAVADPANDFIESNENNNWTSLPITLAAQTAANNGGTANIFCSGSTVIAPSETRVLTASPGTAYSWNTGATSRSITVGAAGTYSCTVTCPCGSLATPSLTLTSLVAPVPVGSGASIVGPGQVSLSATGSDLHWFDVASGGSEVGSGPGFLTPPINVTTNYWVENRASSPGVNLNAGRANNTTQGAYLSSKQWLLFDALKPFKLESFKVRANSIGQRHFVLVDRLGNLIAEKYIEIPAGLNTIVVNWDVPAGVQHKISAFDDNTEVVRDLWYNNAGNTYPYSLGTLGSITGASDGTTNYYYLYDWVVSTPTVNAVSARTQVTATIVNPVALSLNVKLEGPFDVDNGLMKDDLRAGGLIPMSEPYSALGFAQLAGGGGEVITGTPLLTAGNNAIVDWVRVELRSAPSPNVVMATRQALVQRDGDVVSADGVSPITFGVGAGNYYVAVRHRNHLGCMTSAAIPLTSVPTTLDLSGIATGTWGTNARRATGSVMTLWAGNAVLNGQVMYVGVANDRDPILQAVGGVVPTNTATGYDGTDVNLDGVIKYTGINNDRDPILVNVGSTQPNNVLTEQIP
ncbi:MAG: hypothetical protein IPP33_06490 [Flavobacteriales bacterium]|nr:hypothetical protein [Flavobacteriales bacterium]